MPLLSKAEWASSLSTFKQNPDRQREHVQVDRLFADKLSGKDAKRPQLEAIPPFARENDTAVVRSVDRLACNLDDRRRMIQDLTKRSVHIGSLKENLTFTGEDSPMAKLILR